MPLGTGIQWDRITEAWEYRPTDWLNMQWIVEISRINNRNNTLLTYRQMVRCGFWNRQAASSTIHFNTISSATAAVTYSWRSHTHCARSGILACVRSFVYFSDSNIYLYHSKIGNAINILRFTMNKNSIVVLFQTKFVWIKCLRFVDSHSSGSERTKERKWNGE